jgi:hypothetical protein
MASVGETEMRQGIAQKEKTEIIGTAGNGHGTLRQQSEAKQDWQAEDESEAEPGPLTQFAEVRPNQRSSQQQQSENCGERQENKIARTESQRIMEWQERPKDSKQIHGIRAIPA